MDDITPRPKTDWDDAPGSSVSMPDNPPQSDFETAPVLAEKGYFPPVDLVAALYRTEAEAAGAPADQPASQESPASHWLLVLLTALGVLVVVGLGVAYYFWYLPQTERTQPVVVPTAEPTPPPTPTPRPSYRPSPKPTTPAPAAPAPQPRTYTVVAGDTLITIGERLGKDWRQIAAANGNIQDPNFITPGQVLIIP